VLADGAGPVLLISAGIGVTPVLSMLDRLAGRHGERDIWWLRGARGPREHPFAAEARGLLGCLRHAREHVFDSSAAPSGRRRAGAAAGRLTKQVMAGLGLPAGASACLCGPAWFMAGMADALTAIGVEPARIRTELSGALAPVSPGLTGPIRRPPHQPTGLPGAGPLVTFARSGITALFGTHGRSVLDLAGACDVPTRWSCRAGVCHTCSTALLCGGITGSPDPLEPPGRRAGPPLLRPARRRHRPGHAGGHRHDHTS
jgi:ferredoxin-NADP reductase